MKSIPQVFLRDKQPVRFLLVLLLLLVMYRSYAQPSFFNPFLTAENAWGIEKENYLLPIVALERMNLDTLNDRQKDFFKSALYTFTAFVDYQRTLEIVDGRIKEKGGGLGEPDMADASTHLTDFVPYDAVPFLLEQADSFHVILLNEAHHVSYHRVFMGSLLAGLYQKGFTVLALEALQDTAFQTKGYPVYESGFYTRDPLFAEALRYAHGLGYHVVGYDHLADCEEREGEAFFCENLRDSMQAVNIIRAMQANGGGKVFVYAGHSHIKELPSGGHKRLGYYLRELMGQDVLSIDATTMLEHTEAALEEPLYRTLTARYDFSTPMILRQGSTIWSHTPAVDVTVFHPRITLTNGRPDFHSFNRMKKSYPLQQFADMGGFLIQAFYVHESVDHRIPADQTLLQTGDERLYLLPGKYDLVVRDKAGNTLKTKKIRI